MDKDQILKIAQARLLEDKEIINGLKKEASDKEAELKKTASELDGALKKLARYEREKRVDALLDVLIDEKKYFPPEARVEKKAYLMDEKTDLDSFMKIAGDLSPRDEGLFFEPNDNVAPTEKSEIFYDRLANKLAGVSGGGY